MKVDVTHQFKKEYAKAKRSHFADKINELILIVSRNPFQNPPPYGKLFGCDGVYSRRINGQHRLVYSVNIEKQRIILEHCWSHYD